MIVLAIHKETGEIHNDLQDTPEDAYRDGTRARRAAAALGGIADDYFEYPFASKNRGIIFNAKHLIWDDHKKVIKTVSYSETEQKENKRKKDKGIIGHEMIRAQMELDAAEKLGMDITELLPNLDKLKEKYEKVKDKPYG